MRVDDLLKKKDIYYQTSGADFVIRCLNPEHEDRNPSMRIDQVTGIFNCLSCGFKGNLFAHFDAPVNVLDLQREKLKRKIHKVRLESVGIPMPENYEPYRQVWRTIAPETYARFEAFNTLELGMQGRVVFPIRNLSGNIVAFTGRHQGIESPKYLNYPAGAVLPLHPAKVSPIMGSVILVEGIFDMLNLYDKGLTNAVSCFGVNKVTPDKLKLMKIQGVTNIDIFLDNDDAGSKGVEKIKELCEDLDLTYRVIKYGTKDQDPGNLSKLQVTKLRETLYES